MFLNGFKTRFKILDNVISPNKHIILHALIIKVLPWGIDVTFWEPVAIVGGVVYIYIPEFRPATVWLNGVWGEGGGKPDERREGIGGPTGIPLPKPKGGRHRPAAAALL